MIVSPAGAYDEGVHQAITADALRGRNGLEDTRQLPDPASLDRFRLYLYTKFAKLPEFAPQFPNPDAFDRCGEVHALDLRRFA
jgi:hypothetical protein